MKYYCDGCEQMFERDSNDKRINSVCSTTGKNVSMIRIDLAIDLLCKKHLKHQIDLSSFKKKDIVFLEMAFSQGATVMMNYLNK